MENSEHQKISQALKARMRGDGEPLEIPPPVFLAMRGEFVGFDEVAQTLTTRFPVLPEQLNPFGTMQGGMIAAAVDNTVGPLSLLLAPASVTRRLEMKYRRAISREDGMIQVQARLVEWRKRRLHLEATVTDARGVELASCKSLHWVIDRLPEAGT